MITDRIALLEKYNCFPQLYENLESFYWDDCMDFKNLPKNTNKEFVEQK
jgi:hypothetical protein